MSLFKIFNIAGSGMSAQNMRLNITASNIANATTVAGTPEQAYKARQPVFSAVLDNMMQVDKSTASVRVSGIVESQAQHPSRYEPDHPLADEQGYVYQSNVDLVEEVTNMMGASRNYENNVEMLNTSKELLISTLRLGE